jgi:hypothetical protein
MRGSVTVVAILLGLSIVGCRDSNPLPSAPSTLQLVSVGAIGYGSAGQLQLFATAHFSGGGHDVTALATWSNSDPTVANLSTASAPAGVILTMLTPGVTTVTATYQDKTGTLGFHLGYCAGETELTELVAC